MEPRRHRERLGSVTGAQLRRGYDVAAASKHSARVLKIVPAG